MSGPNGAVFISYASQDTEAAKRICDALRAGGIEVWFDQSELRGGDIWDTTIRRQIKTCRLFIPVISRNTHAREEGYFRLEWKLAVDRSHLMAGTKAFLLPVSVDDTRDDDERTPDKFREVQMTRLPAGDTPPGFVERVSRLLSPDQHLAPAPTGPPGGIASSPDDVSHEPIRSRGASWRSQPVWKVIAALAVLGIGYFSVDKFVLSNRGSETRQSAPAAQPVATKPSPVPEKSIAVLPFLDMSEKKDQEYFSDGLSEELIDMLAKIAALHVPARSSSFYFKGKNEKLATIAEELHVAHVLEGSVRKSGNQLRITAQLIRADNGYHLWSQTYDRDATDIFKVQDEIAAAVVKALSLSLLKESMPQSAKTANTAAYSLYLQGRSQVTNGNTLADDEQAINILEQASKLDPGFAPIWATLSRARLVTYLDYRVGSFEQVRRDAFSDAERAVAIDPNSSEGHVMKGRVLEALDWNWAGAEREIGRSLELDSTNPDVLRNAAYLSVSQGRFDEAQRRIKASTELDPLSFYNYMRLGNAEYLSGKPEQAEANFRTAVALQPNADELHSDLALALLAQGKRDAALAEVIQESDPGFKTLTLPIVLGALGRVPEAERALAEAEAKYGEAFPYFIGIIYAARGDLTHAFEWWDRAFKKHDPDLGYFAKAAPAQAQVPQLAADSRYKALLRKLNLPD
jgi:TolB-like protein